MPENSQRCPMCQGSGKFGCAGCGDTDTCPYCNGAGFITNQSPPEEITCQGRKSSQAGQCSTE